MSQKITDVDWDADPPGELVSALREGLGDVLRAVAVYDRDSYTVLHLREDVAARYAAEELEEIFDDLRLEGWGRERLEELFNAGSLDCSVHCFSDAMAVHLVSGEFEGVCVTYDRGAAVDIEDVIEICRTAL